MSSSTTSPLAYAQATAVQRTQALHYLLVRLRRHFPTLPERHFVSALAELRPPLQLMSGNQLITLAPLNLIQLAQYLASQAALPPLDPPLYCQAALELAQHDLRAHELTAAVLPELLSSPVVGPKLLALLTYLLQPHELAERVVQAWRWDAPGSPPLPLCRPVGGGPVLGSTEIKHHLDQLICRARSSTSGTPGV